MYLVYVYCFLFLVLYGGKCPPPPNFIVTIVQLKAILFNLKDISSSRTLHVMG